MRSKLFFVMLVVALFAASAVNISAGRFELPTCSAGMTHVPTPIAPLTKEGDRRGPHGETVYPDAALDTIYYYSYELRGRLYLHRDWRTGEEKWVSYSTYVSNHPDQDPRTEGYQSWRWVAEHKAEHDSREPIDVSPSKVKTLTVPAGAGAAAAAAAAD